MEYKEEEISKMRHMLDVLDEALKEIYEQSWYWFAVYPDDTITNVAKSIVIAKGSLYKELGE